MTSEESAFKIKNGMISILQLYICTADMARIEEQLELRLKQTPDFFSNTPLVLDLSMIAKSGKSLDFTRLVSYMRKHGMCAAGVVGGSEQQRADAVKAGLGLFAEAPVKKAAKKSPPPADGAEAQYQGAAKGETGNLPLEPATISDKPVQPSTPAFRPTVVIDKPVRTGQSIYAEGANLVVLGIVNAGAELIADGDIHVYAPMRGKAIAGAHGNESARIFVHEMEAELLSIAGCFKLYEEGIPENLRGKPVQASLEGSKLLLQPLLR